MTSYKDYYLLLSPGENVIKTIKLCKTLTKSYIDDFPSADSKAHISVAQYTRQKPYVIEAFIENLEAEIKKIPCINLQTNSFDFFVHSKDQMTMYAAIKQKYSVDNWMDNLKRCVGNNNSFTPHITVARTIYIDSFYKVWPRFFYERYEDKFLVDTLYVLEKETLDPNGKWKLYKKLKFDQRRVID